MKEIIKKSLRKLSKTKFVIVLSVLWQFLIWVEYSFLRVKWALTGKKRPCSDETK